MESLLNPPDGTRQPDATQQPDGTQQKVRLRDILERDPCILPDPASGTYYLVASARNQVRLYQSRDLANWTGPQVIFEPPSDIWGEIPVVGIWAPEMHIYRGKYYLFLTFDTRNPFTEQWRNWLPRVTRGSTILVSDAPYGPFQPFQPHSTPPADMMTLDGTLWMEDGVPHMVFCREWVQITNGTIEYLTLKADLSQAIDEPKVLFWGSEAPWSHMNRTYGCHVTDGPSLYASKSGKLFMIWSSGANNGYTTGIAISDSGRLSGPWRQQSQPVYMEDGGHGMLFTTFENKLMMVLHAPNTPAARPRIFEMQDRGETLVITREFTG